jgi:hypothetical protein
MTGPLRSIKVDLNHPDPGDAGVPLGVIVDSVGVEMSAQWYTDANYIMHTVIDIPVGTTVKATQLDIGFHVAGEAHVLQMGPQPWDHCMADGMAVRGDGTSQGTIAHPTASSWIVDLPAGSVGRLFDIHLNSANAVNKGLYYVSLHYVVQR